MKKKSNVIGKAACMVLAMTIICGVLYTIAVTGISQFFFHDKANGSVIEIDGKKYGCELLAQQFTGDEYMWGKGYEFICFYRSGWKCKNVFWTLKFKSRE